MNLISSALGNFFGLIFSFCFSVTGSFGLTIILFTALTRIVLFPISLMSQRNSIIMVKIQPLLQDLQARYAGEPEALIKEQKALYKKEKYSALKALLPLLLQIPIILGVISVVNNPAKHLGDNINPMFMGIDLLALPGSNLFVPFIAIGSTVLLCVVQNFYNVISREQGFFGKWGTTFFLTAFTGWFVFACPMGVGLYWTLANLFAIVVLMICNKIYTPAKYIDYENRSIKPKLTKEEKQAKRERRIFEKTREKEDMKRFFSVKKELVFFSESSGFYKYFANFIDHVLEHSDITVHYLTMDINDKVFSMKRKNFETYFCTPRGLIATFMKMDSDVVVMTMPDLDVYHYKRSLVKKDVEYIYTGHGVGSYHLVLRRNALDHFDTVFCYCKNNNIEIRELEKLNGSREKKIVEVGYGLLDILIKDYAGSEHIARSKPQILVAPSWQKDNILEFCLDPLMDGLSAVDAHIIIRPHPEFVKRFPDKMKRITGKYGNRAEIQTDFSNNSTVYESDLVITDWSSIAQEFSFTTKKPSLFINTPMKVMNPEWRKIGVAPQEISIRDVIGLSLDVGELSETPSAVQKLLSSAGAYKTDIETWLAENMYNIGRAAEAGGGYLISRLRKNGEA